MEQLQLLMQYQQQQEHQQPRPEQRQPLSEQQQQQPSLQGESLLQLAQAVQPSGSELLKRLGLPGMDAQGSVQQPPQLLQQQDPRLQNPPLGPDLPSSGPLAQQDPVLKSLLGSLLPPDNLAPLPNNLSLPQQGLGVSQALLPTNLLGTPSAAAAQPHAPQMWGLELPLLQTADAGLTPQLKEPAAVSAALQGLPGGLMADLEPLPSLPTYLPAAAALGGCSSAAMAPGFAHRKGVRSKRRPRRTPLPFLTLDASGQATFLPSVTAIATGAKSRAADQVHHQRRGAQAQPCLPKGAQQPRKGDPQLFSKPSLLPLQAPAPADALGSLSAATRLALAPLASGCSTSSTPSALPSTATPASARRESVLPSRRQAAGRTEPCNPASSAASGIRCQPSLGAMLNLAPSAACAAAASAAAADQELAQHVQPHQIAGQPGFIGQLQAAGQQQQQQQQQQEQQQQSQEGLPTLLNQYLLGEHGRKRGREGKEGDRKEQCHGLQGRVIPLSAVGGEGAQEWSDKRARVDSLPLSL